MKIRAMILRFFLALMVIIASGTAFASDEPKGDAKTEHADGHDHGHETPAESLKKSLTRYDLGIWTLVVFGLLFFILSRTAWPKIIDGLDKRQSKILQAFAEADQAKQEAIAIRNQLQAELAKANEQIRAMLDEARRDADLLRTSERTAGQEEARAERERARHEIELARDQALQEIYTQAVQLATSISSKVLGRDTSTDDHARLLDQAIAELADTVSHTKPVSSRT